MLVKYECGKYLKEFVESGIVKLTALVFCFLFVEEMSCPLAFSFSPSLPWHALGVD